MWFRSSSRKSPGGFINHPNKEVNRCGRTFDSQAAAGDKYTATLFESSGQVPYYPRERYNQRFRLVIRWHAARPRHSWPGGRRGFSWPLRPEPLQFLIIQRELCRNASQWNANALLWLHQI